uniref:LacI family DNA-binding transcriptional regulator n=1 Tax=Clostridium sp. NkU-1 TaxID=1095009 RepID=UPI000AB3ECC4
MATIKEISQLADVSIATVSRVLNQDDTIVVSQEVKKKDIQNCPRIKICPTQEASCAKRKRNCHRSG